MSSAYPQKTPPRRTRLTPTPFKTPQQTAGAGRGGLLATGAAFRSSAQLKRTVSLSSRTPAKQRGTPYFTPWQTPDRRQASSDNSIGDRFIPSREYQIQPSPFDYEDNAEKKRKQQLSTETPLQKEFKRRMLSTICNIPLDKLSENAEPVNVFSYGRSQSFNSSSESLSERSNPFSMDVLRAMKVSQESEYHQVASKVVRKVPSAPVRILDAPDLVDDYYLSLISWSKDNILAVALARSVYIWNAVTGEISHLISVEGTNYITSVKWCTDQPRYLAVGTNMNEVLLFDGQTLNKLRTMTGFSGGRVASLSWNGQCVSAGDRDAMILTHDIRLDNHVVATYTGHTQEVCGLKWNDDGTCLASGGNENYLCLWDAAMSGRSSRTSEHTPRFTLKDHKAAVKALDWCPFHRGLLASGGGTADRSIKFWNSSSGALLNSIDTGSQVCSIVWSKHQRELCSSHGYSENQLILWKYPSLTKIKELTGHTARVLHMDLSPDGGSIVSAGADETLRFWNIFDASAARESSGCLRNMSLGGLTIR